jgi:hypothetical protein
LVWLPVANCPPFRFQKNLKEDQIHSLVLYTPHKSHHMIH